MRLRAKLSEMHGTRPRLSDERLPAEPINPAAQNQSCDPYTPVDRPYTLGNYPVYSINVTGAKDVIGGMQFAQKHNVRLTIKNTGHDYQGKSAGAGSLSLWTYNLQSIDIIKSYESASNPSNPSSTYKGAAVKLGPDAIGGKVYAALAAKGYRIVGGSCPSVGLVGGYTPGGGHSLLNSKYGMAADQVLEWEVVTAEGKHLVATPTQNEDLYWALSGGAGTFAVVLSITTKIYSKGPVSGGSPSFTLDANASRVFKGQETRTELTLILFGCMIGVGSMIMILSSSKYLDQRPLPAYNHHRRAKRSVSDPARMLQSTQ
ncbi:FAD-binding domain-containing protein [Periconia macrospinosa]|uniref:FAD-binding domain-containing protein n=1 Tax=Periconia macrospinosa TaxID=97972 RepID=A0A2V1D938_9PLEO|nr:FAD-binding domain-containing protein [Periconia macrospinosa]